MVKLKIRITGSNGYLGRLIAKELQLKGHTVLGINRSLLYGPVSVLKNEIRNSNVIINLAGAPILQRWTEKNKKVISDSRIKTTRNLVQAIHEMEPEERPAKFVSASAIGIYQSGISHDENSTRYETKFVGKIVQDWEDSLTGLPESMQLHVLRIGLVLGKNAKTIKNLQIPFRLGLGGKIGSGKQAFPFIHEKDAVNAFVWVIENNLSDFVFNLVAPQNISNEDFSNAFGKQLNRPVFMSIPGFIFKVIYGQAASLLLESPIVEPKALIKVGYKYLYPTIESSLAQILE